MKTRRIARSGEKTFSKSGRMKELEEYEYDVLDQRLSQSNPSVSVSALMTLTDFTLCNARRFYSSMGNPSDTEGLSIQKFSNFALYVVSLGNRKVTSKIKD